MIQTLWITIGLVALAMTTGVVWGGRRQQITSEAGLVGGIAAVALWVVFALNAYNVEVVTNTGTVLTYEYKSLAVLGVAGALIALLAFIEAALAQLNEADYQ